MPCAPFPFPLHAVAPDQRSRAPFLPLASRPRQWLDHPRPAPDSVEIIPATTAFHGSPLPQRPTMPTPPLSRLVRSRRPLEATGATGGSASPTERRRAAKLRHLVIVSSAQWAPLPTTLPDGSPVPPWCSTGRPTASPVIGETMHTAPSWAHRPR
jgi:hypothetical protein